MFHPREPLLKYHQKSSNSCCLSILSSDFHSNSENKDETAHEKHINKSLTLQSNKFSNIIDFANDITKEKLRHKGEQHLRYNLKKCKNKGDFDIINDISENVTLVQLMYTLVNVNYDIIMKVSWIFDYNYEIELHLTWESFDLICFPSVG